MDTKSDSKSFADFSRTGALESAARRASHERLRRIFEVAPAGIAVANSEGLFVQVNPAFCRMMGYSAQELLGMNYAGITHPDDLDASLEHFGSLIAGGVPNVRFEKRYIRKDGEVIWASVWLSPLLDREGRFRESVGVVEDITERRRIEQENALLASIVESSQNAIMTLTTEGVIRSCNRATETIYGYRISEIIGKSMKLLFPPEAEDELARAIEALRSGSPLPPHEARGLRKDGTAIDVFNTFSSIRGKDGRILAAALISRDISAQKRAMCELHASEERLRSLIENAIDGIAVWDADNRVLLTSPSTKQILGYDTEEILGKHGIEELIHPDDRPALAQMIKRGFETPHLTQFYQCKVRRKDGSWAFIEFACRMIRDLDGAPQTLFNWRDVSERVRTAEEMERERDAAREASRLKSAFIANMSHEIRSPLNVIAGYTNLMKEELAGNPGSNQLPYLDAMARASTRLTDTIQKILDISRIEAGVFQIAPRRIELRSLIARVAAELRPAAEKKRLGFSCIVGEPDAAILFDEYCLARALSNLLENAIKFTESGAVTLRLYRDRDAILRLKISDTGAGIQKEYLASLFEIFSQENADLTRRFEGTGLGLALSRRYLELNEAKISVESEPNRGASFKITFPAKIEFAASQEETGPRLGEPDSRLPDATRRATVLVIEDDADTRDLMRALLGKDFNVLVAESAAQARLELDVRGEAVGLILVDIALGEGEDGLSFARWMRSFGQRRPTPIIAVSAFATVDHRQQAFAAGCDAFIPKPVKKGHLLDLVHRMIRRNGQDRAAPASRA